MSQSMRELILSRMPATEMRDQYERGLKMALPADSVLLAGGGKCGTTWTQQILHGLRSNGDMEFENIDDEVPLLELAFMMGVNPMRKQRFQPTMFKIHTEFEHAPRTDKTIVLTRHPEDAAVSLFHFFVDYIFTREEMDIDAFVQVFIIDYGEDNHFFLNASQMRHLASWYPHRNDENVLWLHYEDLKADLKQCINLISDFTGIGVGNQELLDLVEHQASLEFMKAHISQFDDSKFRGWNLERIDLPSSRKEDINIGRHVRNGAVKESRKAFSSKTREAMKQKWMELLKPVTGYDSYEEMRAAVNKELGRSFPA